MLKTAHLRSIKPIRRPVRKVIFPVGGLGTRILLATKAIPKEMLLVVDKRLIQYAVEEAWQAGIEEVIFVTGQGKSAIEDHFDISYELEEIPGSRGKGGLLSRARAVLVDPGRFAYIRQQEPLGLGHVVWCAGKLIGAEPFAVLLAAGRTLSQKPCIAQLPAAHAQVGGNNLPVRDVPRGPTDRYGILDSASEEGSLATARGMSPKCRRPARVSSNATNSSWPAMNGVWGHRVAAVGNRTWTSDTLSFLRPGQATFLANCTKNGNRLNRLPKIAATAKK